MRKNFWALRPVEKFCILLGGEAFWWLRPKTSGNPRVGSQDLVFCFGGVVRGVRSQGENSLGPCVPWEKICMLLGGEAFWRLRPKT